MAATPQIATVSPVLVRLFCMELSLDPIAAEWLAQAVSTIDISDWI